MNQVILFILVAILVPLLAELVTQLTTPMLLYGYKISPDFFAISAEKQKTPTEQIPIKSVPILVGWNERLSTEISDQTIVQYKQRPENEYGITWQDRYNEFKTDETKEDKSC